MTAPVMDADVLTEEDIAPPCELRKDGQTPCPETAKWVGITKCCGAVILFCQSHHDALMALIGEGRVFACVHCRSYIPENPFASLEPL